MKISPIEICIRMDKVPPRFRLAGLYPAGRSDVIGPVIPPTHPTTINFGKNVPSFLHFNMSPPYTTGNDLTYT